MKDFDEYMKGAAERAAAEIKATADDRAYLRTLIEQEAAAQGEAVSDIIRKRLDADDFGTEADDVQWEFELALDAFIGSFYKKTVCTSDGSLRDALLRLGEDSRRRIEARLIEERKDTLRDALRNDFWVFSNLTLLDDRAIQRVLREVDIQELSKALKGADWHVQDKIFRNMSKRAASMLKEDMKFMGPVRLKDVHEAQDRITAIVCRLEEAGEIVIVRNADDEMVW